MYGTLLSLDTPSGSRSFWKATWVGSLSSPPYVVIGEFRWKEYLNHPKVLMSEKGIFFEGQGDSLFIKVIPLKQIKC